MTSVVQPAAVGGRKSGPERDKDRRGRLGRETGLVAAAGVEVAVKGESGGGVARCAEEKTGTAGSNRKSPWRVETEKG